MHLRPYLRLVPAVLLCAGLLVPAGRAATRDRIVQSIAGEGVSPVVGNVHGRALRATDLGAAEASLPISNMTMRFSLTAERQAALTQLLQEQQQPGSANYHRWLTPEQFADQFGMSAGDVAKVSAWLAGQGFTVTGTARSRTFITFSGTAGQVARTFGTTIHNVSLDGHTHYANLTDPVLPAALAAVVDAITGLHDFRLQSHAKTRVVPAAEADAARPEFTSAISGSNFIAPGDFYTIYDESSLLSSNINGTGVTVAVMGQTDISLADVAAFRTASGLSANVPVVKLYGADPGTSKDDIDEAQLDVEWSGAAGPSATILYVNSTDVINVSLTNAIDQNVAPIMTLSYGDCEPTIGQGPLTAYNTLFQQANAQGITILNSSGDSGAAGCDYNSGSPVVASATLGPAVGYPASSPNVTGIGGTMFNEGTGTYFSTTNNAQGGSAISYIPEAVWNEDSTTEGIAAGGGGVSAFFSKPAWQLGTGVPNDFSRDVPDVSLNAASNHDGYLFCSQGFCTNGYRNATNNLDVVGGTSVGTPAFAGLLALVEQKIASRIGNANPTLYALANSTYYANVFHDTTTGSNAVPCTAGSTGCPSNGGTIGYNATPGYDLATGWGSVDAFNMVNDWALVTPLPEATAGIGQTQSATTVTTTTPNVKIGTPIAISVTVAAGTVTNTTPVPTGTVQFLVDGAVSGAAVAVTAGTATFTLQTTALSSGGHTVAAVYSGDATYGGSKGSVAVDVTNDFSIAGSVGTITIASGSSGTVTYTLSSLYTFAGTVSLTTSTTTTLTNDTYAFTPPTVALTSGGSGTTVFTLNAYVSDSKKAPTAVSRNVGAKAPWMVGGGVAFASMLLLGIPGRRRRMTRGLGILSALLLSVAVAGVSGCSSAGSVVVPPPTKTNTAPGTYAVTVTATSGALSHATTLTVVIQ